MAHDKLAWIICAALKRSVWHLPFILDRDAGISLDNVDDEEAEMLDFLMLLMTEHYVVELAECYTRSENEENSITTFIR